MRTCWGFHHAQTDGLPLQAWGIYDLPNTLKNTALCVAVATLETVCVCVSVRVCVHEAVGVAGQLLVFLDHKLKLTFVKRKKKKKKSSCKCHIPVAFLPVYAYAYRPWTTRVIYCECAFHFMCLSQGNYSMSCCRRVINEFLVKRLWA